MTIYAEKIGFIGLGKLGMPCAEAIAKKGFHVAGYDIAHRSSGLVEIRDSIEDLVRDRDIVFVATPTPHEEGYDGREPTSQRFQLRCCQKSVDEMQQPHGGYAEPRADINCGARNNPERVGTISDQCEIAIQSLSDSNGHSCR